MQKTSIVLSFYIFFIFFSCSDKSPKNANENFKSKKENYILTQKKITNKKELFLDYYVDMTINEYDKITDSLQSKNIVFNADCDESGIDSDNKSTKVRIKRLIYKIPNKLYKNQIDTFYVKPFFEDNLLKNFVVYIYRRYKYEDNIKFQLSFYNDFLEKFEKKYGKSIDYLFNEDGVLNMKENYWIKKGILISLYETHSLPSKPSRDNSYVSEGICCSSIVYSDIEFEKRSILKKRQDEKEKLNQDIKIEGEQRELENKIDSLYNKF